MFAAGFLVYADVINILRLDVLKQLVVPYFGYHTKSMPQYRSIVKNEYGLAVITEQGLKFLLVILSGVRFEQIRTYHVVHHIYLMQ
jgi:hypothetical protein